MFRWFQNLRLGGKLIVTFSAIILFTIVVSIVALFAQNRIQESVTQLIDVDGEIADLSQQSEISMLEARRSEKDYLLRYKDVGFEEAYAAYVTEVQDHAQEIRDNMVAIRGIAQDKESVGNTEVDEFIGNTEAIEQAVSDYEDTFLETVDLLEKRGHVDTGLEGTFRDKVHNIEEVVEAKGLDQLTIVMLNIRRREKDYLLRGEQQYVDNVHELVAEFKDSVDETELSATEKGELNQLIDEYETAFDELVQVDRDVTDSIALYREAVHQLEPLLQEIEDHASANQAASNAARQQVAQTATMIIISVSFIVVVLAILFSVLLSRNISNAAKQIAAAAEGIAQGDLEQNVVVDGKDELSDMAVAFQQMIAYMQNMADVATSLADGDLAVDISPKSEHDVLGNAFARMIANLRELIRQVQKNAEQVAEASVQLSLASDQAGQASQQVAATIQQIVAGTNQQTMATAEATSNMEGVARATEGIARGAQEQAQGVQKTSDLIDEMSKIVEQTESVTSLVAAANTKVTSAAKHGVEVVGQTNEGMSQIRQRTAATAEKIREMGTRSKEIIRIVETIDDIADKTDMLALNAAVEAARAGEHGRGFAVVADQVRKLSEDSKGATRDIGELIERVQESVDEAMAAMENTVAEVDNGAQLAKDTDQSLQEILQAAEEATQQFEQINLAMADLLQRNEGVVIAIESVSTVVEENTAVAEEMAANSQEITEAMESVVSVAEENSAATEEASASTEELSAQVEEVVASAKELADLADELRAETARFRLGSAG